MPYGYYQIVRFIGMAAFIWMAFEYYQEKNEKLAYTFGTLALLFLPFFKVALGRVGWNVVDVVVAVGLMYLWWKEMKNK